MTQKERQVSDSGGAHRWTFFLRFVGGILFRWDDATENVQYHREEGDQIVNEDENVRGFVEISMAIFRQRWIEEFHA